MRRRVTRRLIWIQTVCKGNGIKCLQCRDLPHPEVCDQMTDCPKHSNCLLREYVTTSGAVLFSSGCVSHQKCNQIHRRDSEAEDFGFDVDLCLECCNSTDYCNIDGCGTKVTDRRQRGPYCFECSFQNDVNGCRNIRRCDIGQECDVINANTHGSTSIVTTGNLSITLPHCCKNDFCNDIFNFVNNATAHSIHANGYAQTAGSSWTAWSQWSACSKTCGPGRNRARTRICIYPHQYSTGPPCTGNGIEQIDCTPRHCPVNGAWSKWEAWSDCPVTCGRGYKSRQRKCNNPPPQHNGTDCPGDAKHLHGCGRHACPVDGAWSHWSPWSNCPVTCGTGNKSRHRTCDNPAPHHNGTDCKGDSQELHRCNKIPCPVDGAWSSWGPWSDCPVTCGGGNKSRHRKCDNPAPHHKGAACQGDAQQLHRCNAIVCPVDGAWSTWSPWTNCPVTCGGGNMSRARKCDNPRPRHNGAACIGDALQIQGCGHTACPVVNGDWSVWGPWSMCDASCGRGLRWRQRTCDNPRPQNNGAACRGRSHEPHRCILHDCPGNMCRALGKIGFTLSTGQGRQVCVTLNVTVASWQDARAQCVREGGDLVTVDSSSMDKEIEHILQLHLKPGHEYVWLGLASFNHKWHWVNPAVDFQYNNLRYTDNRHHSCVLAHTEIHSYSWWADPCSMQFPYLCEFQ